ncbi:MAG: hypothetical protein ABIR68_14505 [Ilumatobacteraceae bacterium]
MDLHTWMLNDLASVRSKLCDGVLARVPPEQWADQGGDERGGGGSSIRHLALHIARHQDLAVNTAVRDHEPLFVQHREALGLARAGTGAALAEHEDPAVSGAPTKQALTTYVDAVFAATLPWLDKLGSMVLDTVPDTPRRLRDHAGLSDDELGWLFAMWTDKPVWWFLQWPVIGHGHTHAGEATAMRNRLGFSPFAPPAAAEPAPAQSASAAAP